MALVHYQYCNRCKRETSHLNGSCTICESKKKEKLLKAQQLQEELDRKFFEYMSTEAKLLKLYDMMMEIKSTKVKTNSPNRYS